MTCKPDSSNIEPWVNGVVSCNIIICKVILPKHHGVDLASCVEASSSDLVFTGLMHEIVLGADIQH